MAKESNQPAATIFQTFRFGGEDYDLVTTYLGWTPNGFKDWQDFSDKNMFKTDSERTRSVTLTSPDGTCTVRLDLLQILSKDAFPLSFFSEAKEKNWWRFCIVAMQENPKAKYIIPLH